MAGVKGMKWHKPKKDNVRVTIYINQGIFNKILDKIGGGSVSKKITELITKYFK